jgi:outer membrane protein OmpA-like peptidoglycan-associated protein
MSGIEETGKKASKAAKKIADVAGDGVDAAKAVAGDAANAVGDAAEAGLDAAKGALGAVGGMLGGLAGKVGDVAGDAVDAAKGAVDGVADKVGDVAEGALDAAKGAFGAVGNVAEGAADKIGGAGVAAVGAGAAVLGGAAAAVGGLGKGLTGASASGGGSDDGLPPMAARLDAAGRANKGPGILLPFLGVAGLGLLAYFGFHTIAQGNGTLFPQKAEAPVVAPAPAKPALPAWLSAIGDKLKATFAWLTLGFSGNSVIANGEAETQADKDNALKEIVLAVKAAPEGANTDVIDNIKVKGSTETPVGAALAALGANPDVAACNTAFATTMAGRTINFSTGGASISADNASLLNTLTAVANACKVHKIEIGGHTDSVGKPENNQALSQKRADAVKAYWTGKGVAAEGLVATGYGETKPVEPVADETENAKNRRIEFTVTDAAAVPAAPAAPAAPEAPK